MDVPFVAITLTSDRPDELRTFYREVVGLPTWPEMDFAVAAGPAMLSFDNHSEISGTAREPARWLLSVGVDDLPAETARLKAAGVTCIRDQGKEAWGGRISTFLDPDGNYFQLMAGPDANT